MDKYEVRNAAFFTRRSDCSIRSDNEIAGAMAPLKLNSLLSIVALQFTFASVTFIVRFKHHPPSRFQMAETNVRLPLASSLPPHHSHLLLQHLFGRRAKLEQMGVFCISFERDSHSANTRSAEQHRTVSPNSYLLVRGCSGVIQIIFVQLPVIRWNSSIIKTHR